MRNPTGEVKIRKLTPGDVPGIRNIDKKIVGKERALSYPQRVDRYLEMYFPPLSHVAEVDGAIVGFILGDVRGWEYAMPASGWIDIIGVAPDYQRQGIGRKLIEVFVEECRRRNMKARAIIREGDERITRLFTAAGFQRGQLVDYER